jgi:sterol desaturase/sphingolipid hydroxylase (fatty acid hydroxylase superfamily)
MLKIVLLAYSRGVVSSRSIERLCRENVLFMGAFWYYFFAGTGEYFYHANVRTPHWLRYLIQTPELHSIHHQFDVHKYNFSDIPLSDRMLGTYKEPQNSWSAADSPKAPRKN